MWSVNLVFEAVVLAFVISLLYETYLLTFHKDDTGHTEMFLRPYSEGTQRLYIRRKLSPLKNPWGIDMFKDMNCLQLIQGVFTSFTGSKYRFSIYPYIHIFVHTNTYIKSVYYIFILGLRI